MVKILGDTLENKGHYMYASSCTFINVSIMYALSSHIMFRTCSKLAANSSDFIRQNTWQHAKQTKNTLRKTLETCLYYCSTSGSTLNICLDLEALKIK